MHRDITRMNTPYFPDGPRHAAISDYVKLCVAATATNTTPAGWPCLILEIEQERFCMYGQEITNLESRFVSHTLLGYPNSFLEAVWSLEARRGYGKFE